jgi:hypothetical protein
MRDFSNQQFTLGSLGRALSQKSSFNVSFTPGFSPVVNRKKR